METRCDSKNGGKDGDVIDIRKKLVQLPVWSLLSGAVALVTFGIGLGMLAWSVQNSVKMNMERNDMNHQTEMAAIDGQSKLLKQIVCQNRWQLYHGREPASRYNGECE